MANPTKGQLARDIAEALRLHPPAESRGSSIDSTFLDRIHEALTGDEAPVNDAYRKAERVLQDLELTYDPFWDTSESAEKGGSTVTNRAYSRIRSAVTGVPRCFVLNVTDAQVGARWETDHQVRYRYDATVTGRGSLNDAGPGSRILYYSTSKSRQSPKHFIAHAEVTYIGPGWSGPWEASIGEYSALERPVPVSLVELGGWNRQHAITEVDFDTFNSILAAGGQGRLRPRGSAQLADPGGDVVARRIIDEIPFPTAVPSLVIPPLPHGMLVSQPAAMPTYTEDAPGGHLTSDDNSRRTSNHARNKLAEKRAVDLSHAALTAQGWSLKRDRQKDGVGYDLLYTKDDRELHVEVKGILGSSLAFNLTPKESWRVETDHDFLVIAVTRVLSPAAFEFNLLTREDLTRARRVVTGFRLHF